MRLGSFFVSVATTTLLFSATAAHAQRGDVAETHFKRGVSLYQEADFRAALVEFRRAYELSHNWRLLYNVAQAEYQTREYAAALATFEAYLREGGDKVPKARRAEVDQELARLRQRVGKVTVRANVEGATVFVDDEAIGAPPATRNVAVGERRIVVKKEGYVAWSKTVDVAGNDDVALDATLEPVAPPSPPPVPPVVVAPAHRFPWEPWVVTGVLAAGAVTTGVLALSASSSLDDAKGRFDVTDAELESASSRVSTFSVLTDVLLVATAASAGIALYITLKKPAAASDVPSTGLRLAPALGGVAAWGRF